MSQLVDEVLTGVGRVLFEGLFKTVRYKASGAEHYLRFWHRSQPVIFVIWHGRLLPLAYLHRCQGLATLVSRSRDGGRIAKLIEHWGYNVVRGSSSRGGSSGFRQMVRLTGSGHSLVFAADGPRGPRQRLKLGVLTAARLTGLAIIPVAAGTDRAWSLGSWDRFLVPKPFSLVRVAYGEPMRVPPDASASGMDALRQSLQVDLNELMARVDGDDA